MLVRAQRWAAKRQDTSSSPPLPLHQTLGPLEPQEKPVDRCLVILYGGRHNGVHTEVARREADEHSRPHG